MNRLDKLLEEVRAMPVPETITLIYADGTQKALGAFDATMAVLEAQVSVPAVVATDQPPGGLIWAILSADTIGDCWENVFSGLSEPQEAKYPKRETSAFREPQEETPPPPSRNGVWPAYM